jgi:hypothetical protein
MTGEAREFGRHLFKQIEEGRGHMVERAPTPRERDSAERTRWIRAAVAGQRESEWEEEDDPMPEAHAALNAHLRSATEASRHTTQGE